MPLHYWRAVSMQLRLKLKIGHASFRLFTRLVILVWHSWLRSLQVRETSESETEARPKRPEKRHEAETISRPRPRP